MHHAQSDAGLHHHVAQACEHESSRVDELRFGTFAFCHSMPLTGECVRICLKGGGFVLCIDDGFVPLDRIRHSSGCSSRSAIQQSCVCCQGRDEAGLIALLNGAQHCDALGVGKAQ